MSETIIEILDELKSRVIYLETFADGLFKDNKEIRQLIEDFRKNPKAGVHWAIQASEVFDKILKLTEVAE